MVPISIAPVEEKRLGRILAEFGPFNMRTASHIGAGAAMRGGHESVQVNWTRDGTEVFLGLLEATRVGARIACALLDHDGRLARFVRSQ